MYVVSRALRYMALFITKLWKSVILTTTASLMISTLPAMLENSLIFDTKGCGRNRLFYKLAGFNHPSVSSNAEQWVSSISKGRSVIEFTFSEGFRTCANVSKTCLTNDRISGSPSFCHFPHAQRSTKNNDSGDECQAPASFWFLLPFCYPGYVPSILLIKAFMNQIRVGPLSVPTLMYTKASERRFTKTKWPFPAPSFIAACWCVQGQRPSANTPQLLNKIDMWLMLAQHWS